MLHAIFINLKADLGYKLRPQTYGYQSLLDYDKKNIEKTFVYNPRPHFQINTLNHAPPSNTNTH